MGMHDFGFRGFETQKHCTLYLEVYHAQFDMYAVSQKWPSGNIFGRFPPAKGDNNALRSYQGVLHKIEYTSCAEKSRQYNKQGQDSADTWPVAVQKSPFQLSTSTTVTCYFCWVRRKHQLAKNNFALKHERPQLKSSCTSARTCTQQPAPPSAHAEESMKQRQAQLHNTSALFAHLIIIERLLTLRTYTSVINVVT